MSDHEGLCLQYQTGFMVPVCVCDLIAKARADEREKIAQRLHAWGNDKPRVSTWQDTAARIARQGGGE